MKANQPNKKQKDGLQKEYFRDGSLSSAGKYQNGKRTGTWKFYLRNGKLRATGKFLNGKFTGLWKWK
jgi:antitoxin component YwqK of YwqJK toxin-antitoxin module